MIDEIWWLMRGLMKGSYWEGFKINGCDSWGPDNYENKSTKSSIYWDNNVEKNGMEWNRMSKDQNVLKTEEKLVNRFRSVPHQINYYQIIFLIDLICSIEWHCFALFMLKPWSGQLGRNSLEPSGIPTRGRLGFQSKDSSRWRSNSHPWLVGRSRIEPLLGHGSWRGFRGNSRDNSSHCHPTWLSCRRSCMACSSKLCRCRRGMHSSRRERHWNRWI